MDKIEMQVANEIQRANYGDLLLARAKECKNKVLEKVFSLNIYGEQK